MSDARRVITWIEAEFGRYKALAEGVIDQLGPEEIVARASSESNSVAMLVWHMGGNLVSRFTDFLTTDGEKAWRNRDSEFEERNTSRDELMEKWNAGWSTLFAAVEPLVDSDLERVVVIRGVDTTVGEALLRALAHASYHVGQIAFYGKVLKGSEWTYLSIPPGGSDAYNLNPTRERGADTEAGNR